MKHVASLTTLVLLWGCAAVMAVAGENQYQTGLQSTVWIVAGQSEGSGVLVDAEKKLVVTNYHVVGNIPEVEVYFAVQQEDRVVEQREFYREKKDELCIVGKVTVRDPRRDLVLVELARLPEEAVAATLAEQSPSPGDTLHSIGNPDSSAALWVYTSGSVRQVYEAKMRMPNGIPLVARVIETQAPVNPGDSGGPAFNANNELAGIVQSYQVGARLVSRCIDVSEVAALLKGDIKTWDPRVSNLLDSKGIRYSINPIGIISVPYGKEGEEPLIVMIDSKTYQVGKTEVREVKTHILRCEKPIPEALANELLTKTFQHTLGSWCVHKSEDALHVLFIARVDANADPESLLDAVTHVLNVTTSEAELIARLRAAQAFPVDKLYGKWTGKTKGKNGVDRHLEIRFSEDLSFSFDDQTMLLRGSYEVVDGTMYVTIGGNRSSLGPPRLVESGQLTLNIGEDQVTFRRTEGEGTQVTEALAAAGDRAQ